MNYIYSVARLTVSAVWFYHGLVPKLIFKHPDEFAPLLAVGVSQVHAGWIVQAAGVAEMVAAAALLIFWKAKAGFWITIGFMSVALISITITVPHLLVAAFNPFSLNLSMIALSLIGLAAAPVKGKGH